METTKTETKEKKRKKDHRITTKTKKEILSRLDKGARATDLATEYGIDPSAIAYYKKKRATIMSASDASLSTKISSSPALDSCVYEWWKLQRSRNLTVSQLMLMEKAKEFAEGMKQQIPHLSEFKASKGWLFKYLNRHPDCKQLTLHGESASVKESDAHMHRVQLREELCKFQKEDIFNCDETALFYRLLPTQTLGSKGDKGIKADKSRVTLLLCVNSDGSEKLKPLMIGKYKNPRALNKINRSNLLCQYTNSPKAWMNKELFLGWLSDWDAKLRARNRKILLLVDNVSSHSKIDTSLLTHITLLFLPPNFTCHLQPLDAGIIRSFKAHYRRLMVRYLIKGYDENNSMPVLNIKNAIDLSGEAWKLVKPTTISNCWKHTHLFPTLEEMNDAAIDEIDGVMKELQESLDNLKVGDGTAPISASAVVDCDAKEATEAEIEDAMIIEDALAAANGNDEKKEQESDDETEPEIITPKEAIQAVSKAISFLEQSIPNSIALIDQFKAVIELAETKRMNALVQRSIQHYFSS